MERLKERALAKGIVEEEDWEKVVQYGHTKFVEIILRLLDLHERRPEVFPPRRSPAVERAEWREALRRAGDRIDLEDVDRVQPGKTFMPPAGVAFNIPAVLLPLFNKLASKSGLRLPPDD